MARINPFAASWGDSETARQNYMQVVMRNFQGDENEKAIFREAQQYNKRLAYENNKQLARIGSSKSTREKARKKARLMAADDPSVDLNEIESDEMIQYSSALAAALTILNDVRIPAEQRLERAAGFIGENCPDKFIPQAMAVLEMYNGGVNTEAIRNQTATLERLSNNMTAANMQNTQRIVNGLIQNAQDMSNVIMDATQDTTNAIANGDRDIINAVNQITGQLVAMAAAGQPPAAIQGVAADIADAGVEAPRLPNAILGMLENVQQNAMDQGYAGPGTPQRPVKLENEALPSPIALVKKETSAMDQLAVRKVKEYVQRILEDQSMIHPNMKIGGPTRAAFLAILSDIANVNTSAQLRVLYDQMNEFRQHVADVQSNKYINKVLLRISRVFTNV
jgi:hypothetical protein